MVKGVGNIVYIFIRTLGEKETNMEILEADAIKQAEKKFKNTPAEREYYSKLNYTEKSH